METMNLTLTSPSNEQQLSARRTDVFGGTFDGIGNGISLPQIPTTLLPALPTYMPTRGCALVSADADAVRGSESVRTRKVVAQGHVAFAAYVSGHPAWSPPLC